MIVVIQVGQTNRMAHLVTERTRRKIGRSRTFKLKIKGMHPFPVYSNRVAHRVLGKEFHVRPQQLSPSVYISLHYDRQIVYVPVIIPVQ